MQCLAEETADEPQEQRGLGRLRNGNRSGDFRLARRCLARNRAGLPCMAPALKGKLRCRLHGGWSRGPTTANGLARSRAARLRHGMYSREAADFRQEARQWSAVVRTAIQASEAALIAMPRSTDTKAIAARCQRARVISEELWRLYESLHDLLRAKLSQPLDLGSPGGLAAAVKVAAWARLAKWVNECGKAAVVGPAGARFLA